MRLASGLLGFLVVALSGCSQFQPPPPATPPQPNLVSAWPKDWSASLGQTVTLEGAPRDSKEGAVLQGEGNLIWIDGLDFWPQDIRNRLQVTGTVIKKDDVPAFVQKPGEPPKAGVPVQSEEEREKAKWRYLLKDAKWTVLE
jgi:hypothetical protein